MSDPERDYDAEMKLPPGKTCGDCRSCSFCAALGFTKPENASCDFWPSRFCEALTTMPEKAG